MIYRSGIILILLCFSVSAFCIDAAPPALDESVQKQAVNAWREHRLDYGKEVYTEACASCHDEGMDGAPAIGDREAWSRRSPLWSGVLMKHSREGYLEMPARGSHDELSDQAVDAAAEYLLSVTFPEFPLD